MPKPVWLFLTSLLIAGDSSELFQAIRRADTAKVRKVLDSGLSADAVDTDGTPAVMAATLFADAACLKLLLQRGANPDATTPTGATALMWAVPDLGKVRLLAEHGASINARSTNLGRTPLLIAAGHPGSVPILRLLLSKGAELRAKDRNGENALGFAVRSADIEVVRFLLERGFGVNDPGSGGTLPLTRAVARPYMPVIEFLLSKGAKVGPNALINATHWQDAALIERMLAMGADINARAAAFGRTPLIQAAASEVSSAATLKLLLERGADPKIADNDGETALDWAMHRADPEKIAVLKQYGATEGSTPRDRTYAEPEGVSDIRKSLALSVALLLPTGSPVFVKRGCISCHSQSMPQQVAVAAREKGIPVDEGLARKNFQQMLAVYRPLAEEAMQGQLTGGGELTIGYIMMALAAEKHPLDKITAAQTHAVAARQMPDGSWPEATSRPPMEYSTISRTAMAVRTLTLYPIEGRRKEIDERLRRARAWLLAQRPFSVEEHAMRLMALAWAGAPRASMDIAARELIALQRGDGGWAQLPHLASDAYGTGIALHALHEGGCPVTNASYEKGIRFLLKRQYKDGSWFVKTRSFPVQPQQESGYPFGYNQWISAAAASWASLAIAHTLPAAR